MIMQLMYLKKMINTVKVVTMFLFSHFEKKRSILFALSIRFYDWNHSIGLLASIKLIETLF